MFIVSKVKDTICVDAEDMEDDRGAIIKQVIAKKYANKILANVGLVVAVFDILDASEGMVLHGDGCLYHKVVFRLVVFKPFLSETFEARVCASAAWGLTLSMRIFEDIKVPAYKMFENSAFDPEKKLWYWAAEVETEAPEGADPEQHRKDLKAALARVPEDDRLYIHLGEMVRVRLDEELFQESGPKKPPKAVAPAAAAAAAAAAENGDQQQQQAEPEIPPWTLVCSMDEQGLGVVDWWTGQEGEEEEEEQEDTEMQEAS